MGKHTAKNISHRHRGRNASTCIRVGTSLVGDQVQAYSSLLTSDLVVRDVDDSIVMFCIVEMGCDALSTEPIHPNAIFFTIGRER
jgi:hypothetical protein